MYAASARRLNVGPVIPGAAPYALEMNEMATVSSIARRTFVFEIAFFMFVVLMAALLVDSDFGHQSAKVFCVIRKVIEIWGIEEKHAARWILRGIACVEYYVH